MVGKWFKINELCILHTKNVAIFVKTEERILTATTTTFKRELLETTSKHSMEWEREV